MKAKLYQKSCPLGLVIYTCDPSMWDAREGILRPRSYKTRPHLREKKMNEQKPMASPQAEARVLISENTSYQDAVRVGTQAVTGL